MKIILEQSEIRDALTHYVSYSMPFLKGMSAEAHLDIVDGAAVASLTLRSDSAAAEEKPTTKRGRGRKKTEEPVAETADVAEDQEDPPAPAEEQKEPPAEPEKAAEEAPDEAPKTKAKSIFNFDAKAD